MLVIGLTGGIGSGKTTVGGMLREMGAASLNADLLGHEMIKPPSPLLQEIVSAFGNEFLLPSGELDRKKLGEKVFKDKKALAHLNRIMHPRMLDAVKKKIAEWRKEGYKVGVVEAAALIEARWDEAMDEVWVTTAPKEIIIERLQKNKGISRDEVISRMNSQLLNGERQKKSMVVIDTGCSIEELRKRVSDLYREAVLRASSHYPTGNKTR